MLESMEWDLSGAHKGTLRVTGVTVEWAMAEQSTGGPRDDGSSLNDHER